MSERLLKVGQSERSEFNSLIEKSDNKSAELTGAISPWSHWYSVSFDELLACIVCLGGLDGLFSNCEGKSKNEVQENFLLSIESAELSVTNLADEVGNEMADMTMLQLCFALDFNQCAIARRNRSINEMLAQVRDKVDDYEEIIFEAISIDKSVVTNFEIAEHISRWTICNETKLLKKLSKAIAGKYPRNSRMVGLDDHRYMTAVLKDISGEPTPQMVNEMNQLLKTMAEGDDPIRQIRNHLDIRARDTRKSKRKSSS
ncbi:MAG: hypothetical protein VX870_09345 [Pseudomonadota bacterium]|nr:hypothetical protein [Pseudomonadota bacterium]